MAKSRNNKTLKTARRKVVLSRLEKNLETQHSTRKDKTGSYVPLERKNLQRIEKEVEVLRYRISNPKTKYSFSAFEV